MNSSMNCRDMTKSEADFPACLGRESISHFQAFLIFGLLVVSYFCTSFFRISASVIMPRLGIEWSMSATLIGFISALYYYAYALMQPISGALNDRFGPVRIVAGGMFLTFIGTLLMGFASSPWQFGVGRFLTGLGLAPMLSGTLVFQAAAFDNALYTRLSSITYTIGNLGAVISVAPLELAIKTWGKQSVFAGLSVISLLIVMGLLIQKKKDPVLIKVAQTQAEPLWQRLGEAFSLLCHSIQLQAALIIWAVATAAHMAFQGLWAVSWYRTAYNVDLSKASGWATLIGVGLMLGNFIGGNFGNGPYQRRRVIRISYTAYGISWILLWVSIAVRLPIYITGLIGFANGLLAGFSFVQSTCGVNDMAPEGKGGALFGVMNLFNFLVVIIFQSGTGYLLNWFPAGVPGTYTAKGYLIVLGSVTVTLLLSLTSLFFLRPFSQESVEGDV